MQVLQRVGYYMGGFAVGLVLLAFFLKGSNTEIPSCDYMPNARVLKTIRNRGYVLTPQLKEMLSRTAVDTVQLNRLFREGTVDFDKSDQQQKPCGTYYILSPESEKNPIHAEVSICENGDQVEIMSLSND